MSKTADAVAELVAPIIDSLGMELVEVDFSKTRQGDALTVFIDKEGGVSLDDCEAVHNAIDAPLDDLDPTDGKPYTLNVSSPGLDRPYKTARDYEKHIGTASEVSLFAPLEKLGKKFVAILENYDAESGDVTLDAAGKKITINKKDIALIREHIEF
ncbi:MAG TPA: ribosome maturation factor RimP [Candidatus Ornithoclostridium excrementipullorum]|nr:ribosome maturation factor RimP [Candidatus Ornithoclostridium excrementipullorum]